MKGKSFRLHKIRRAQFNLNQRKKINAQRILFEREIETIQGEDPLNGKTKTPL